MWVVVVQSLIEKGCDVGGSYLEAKDNCYDVGGCGLEVKKVS